MKKINFNLSKQYSSDENFYEIGQEFLKKILTEKLEEPFFSKKGEKKQWSLDVEKHLCSSEYFNFFSEKLSERLDSLRYDTLLMKEDESFFGGGILQYGKNKNLLILKKDWESYGYRRLLKGIGNKKRNVCFVTLYLSSSDELSSIIKQAKDFGYTINKCISLISDTSKIIHINNFSLEYVFKF